MNRRTFFSILFFSLVFTCYPVIVGSGITESVFFFFLLLVGSGVIGFFLLAKVFQEDTYLNVIFFIPTGFIVIASLDRVHTILPYLLFALICCVYLINWYRKKSFILLDEKVELKSDVDVDFALLLLISFAYLFVGADFFEAKHMYVTNPTSSDSYYFSAVTESLANSSYWNCFYDFGAPLNYQFASFLIPSFFTKITSVTGHQALWLFSMPFYKMNGILIFCCSLKRLLQLSGIGLKMPLTITAILLFTLTSINPLNIIYLKMEGFVLRTSGNFLPGANPGLTFGFMFLPVALLLIIKGDKSISKNFVIVGIIILILFSKIALWLPLILFYLTFSGLDFLFTRKLWPLFFGITAFALSLALYWIFYSTYPSSQIILDPFTELPQFINQYFHISGASRIKQLALFGIYLILAFGIRLILLTVPFWKKDKDNFRVISYSVLVTILVCSFLILTLKIYYMGSSGEILINGSFDLEQFLRSAYILVLFISVFFLLYAFNYLKGISKYLAVGVVLFYCTLSAVGNVTFIYKFKSSYTDEKNIWREEVRNAFLKENRKVLLCMLGNSFEYKAHDLCADGIGPWWYSGRRGDGSYTYFQSNKNYYRFSLVDSLMAGQNPQVAALVLKNGGVTGFVISPPMKNRMESIAKSLNLVKSQKSEFIYEFRQD